MTFGPTPGRRVTRMIDGVRDAIVVEGLTKRFGALVVGDPDSGLAASFPIMAPLVFASSAFIPVAVFAPLGAWRYHRAS